MRNAWHRDPGRASAAKRQHQRVGNVEENGCDGKDSQDFSFN
jgi:hypothetical protein